MKIKSLPFILLASGLFSSISSADILTLDADQTAYVNKSQGETNFGTSNNLQLINVFASNGTFMYLSWDLSSLPEGALITDANITLFKAFSSPETTNTATITVRQATSAWEQATVTYDTRPTYDTLELTSLSLSDTDYTDPEGTPYTITSTALTDLISNWADGTTTNDGLAFFAPAMSSGTTFSFRSNNSLTPAYIPELSITYTIPEPSAALVITPLAAFIFILMHRRRKNA